MKDQVKKVECVFCGKRVSRYFVDEKNGRVACIKDTFKGKFND